MSKDRVPSKALFDCTSESARRWRTTLLAAAVVSFCIAGILSAPPRLGAQEITQKPVPVPTAYLELPEEGDERDRVEEGAEVPYDGIHLGDITLRGSLDQWYRFRESGGSTDQDLYGYLAFSAEYLPDRRGGKPFASRLALNFQGSYNYDLGSIEGSANPATSDFDPFFDISNTYSNKFRGYLYELNLEAKDLFVFEDVRLGRQTVYREQPLMFDGAYVRTQRWKTFTLDAYGGVPVHLYDSSRSGDVLAGVGIASRPLRGLDLGIDYAYIRDSREDIPDAADNLFLLHGRYSFLREWTVGAAASWLGSKDLRQTLDVRYLSEAVGFLGQFRFLRQSRIADFFSTELSPYVPVMGTYQPFYQFQLDLQQPLFGNYALGCGFNIRQLADSSDSGEFNHSFENFYLSFDMMDLWDGMKLMLRGDLWFSDGDDIYTTGIEFEQKVWIARVRLGTSYSLYRLDVVTGDERNDDRIYYVKVLWQLSKQVALDTEYRYERDSDSDYHVVLGGVRIWF